MEANKIKGEAKSLVLDNGVELTYCERGGEHDEVMICGAFYFHTFMPVMELLAKRYHVYGVVMRFDGSSDIFDTDGDIHWTRQCQQSRRSQICQLSGEDMGLVRGLRGRPPRSHCTHRLRVRL